MKKNSIKGRRLGQPSTPGSTRPSSAGSWASAGRRSPPTWLTAHRDALLPYTLPKIDEVVKHLLPAHMLLAATPDPTGADVDRAMAAFSCVRALRQRQAPARGHRDRGGPRVARRDQRGPGALPGRLCDHRHDAGRRPAGRRAAASSCRTRCGGCRRGRAVARWHVVAALEHAVARCGQLAAHPGVRPSVVAALRHAATALKLQQLAPLYELHEAVECDDDPHPLGTGAARLVTRPCAVVRGTLSFPLRPGVAPLTEECSSAQTATPLTQDASLAQAMGKTAADTAALRNGLRRQGLASNVYVAPEAHELAFRSAPTGTTGNQRLDAAIAEASGLLPSEQSAEEPQAVRALRVELRIAGEKTPTPKELPSLLRGINAKVALFKQEMKKLTNPVGVTTGESSTAPAQPPAAGIRDKRPGVERHVPRRDVPPDHQPPARLHSRAQGLRGRQRRRAPSWIRWRPSSRCKSRPRTVRVS